MRYVPLFDGILESTLWDEKLEVRTLYFTMLLLMDADFVVRLDFEKIARKSRLRSDRRENYQEAEKALKVLMAPDAFTMAEQHDDGIRVQKVEGGYFVVSGQKYQDLMFEVNAARKRRRAQQERRKAERERVGRGQPLPGERAAVKAERNGDEKGAQRIAEASLPHPPLKGDSPGIPGRGDVDAGTSSGPELPGPETVFEPGEQIGLPPGPEFQE